VLRAPQYSVVNARLAWRLPDGKTQVTLWGDNLANKSYPVYMYAILNPGGADNEVLASPRTYGVIVRYSF
jgi:outer membrane receptor protein involved in Fe transport